MRVHIPVGVAYDCDLPLAQKLMIEAASEPARVLESRRRSVWLIAFGESSVDHEILVWITDPEAGVGSVRSEILNRLWVLFQENKIEIPFPQRDMHIKDWPGLARVESEPRRSGPDREPDIAAIRRAPGCLRERSVRPAAPRPALAGARAAWQAASKLRTPAGRPARGLGGEQRRTAAGRSAGPGRSGADPGGFVEHRPRSQAGPDPPAISSTKASTCAELRTWAPASARAGARKAAAAASCAAG